MALVTAFIGRNGALDALVPLAELVSPRELLSVSAASKKMKSVLGGNSSLLRASLELYYLAQQTLLIDLLNAPEANSKDTFDARYGRCVAAGGFPAKPEPVTGYKQHCAEKNRERTLELVATWETLPDAPRVACLTRVPRRLHRAPRVCTTTWAAWYS